MQGLHATTITYEKKARKQRQAASFYQIATGRQAEMECSKSTVSLLRDIYRPGMCLADIGCGAGHYLRSFRERLDDRMRYFGFDAGQPHIAMARKAFGGTPFVCADIHRLPVAANSFDIVLCCNVITALPPPPDRALAELIRISRRWVVLRLEFGAANYVVKVYPDDLPANVDARRLFEDGSRSTYRNIYTENYIGSVIRAASPAAQWRTVPDNQFKNFNQHNPNPLATRVVNGMQIAGSLVIDQRYVIIEKG